MKKHYIVSLLLIMLFVCLNTVVFGQKKTTDKTLRQTEEPTTKTQVKKKAKKRKASTISGTKKKTAKKVGITKETVKEENLKTKICSDSLVAKAKSYLGTHYQYASCVPSAGFDCSGFVYHVFSTFDTKVPRSSIDYGSLKDTIAPEYAQIGDIIVFTGTNAKIRHAGHVGIVISNPGEELTFIHSSSNTKRGGVIISTYKSSPYYKNRFLKIVRLENAVVGNCGL